LTAVLCDILALVGLGLLVVGGYRLADWLGLSVAGLGVIALAVVLQLRSARTRP